MLPLPFLGGRPTEDGSLTRIGAYGSTHTISCGQDDPNRTLIILKTQFSFSTFGGNINAPTINGVNATVLYRRYNDYAGNGHRIGVFYVPYPTNPTAELVVGESTLCTVYRLTGVTDPSVYANQQEEHNQDVTLTNVAGGPALVAGVWSNNLNLTSVPGCNESDYTNTKALHGLDYAMSASPLLYDLNAASNDARILDAIGWEYNV